MKSDEPDRVAPSTAPAAATAEREQPLPGEIPRIGAAAEIASRDDLTDEPEESQLMFGPAGLTEVPLFAGAARLVSVGSATHFDQTHNIPVLFAVPPKPASRMTEALANPRPVRIALAGRAERSSSEASSQSDELYMDPCPPPAADGCPHTPRMPRLARKETDQTTAAGPTG